MVSQTEAAEKELAAFLRRAENIDDEDLASGRNGAPMLATKCTGHFCYLHEIQDSCPREPSLSLHVRFLSSSVAGQIPFVDANPQQHSMEQFQRTLEIASVFKERDVQLWHSFNRCTQTAKKLSDKCHTLQTTFVKRVPGKDFLEEHDAVKACAD